MGNLTYLLNYLTAQVLKRLYH